MTAPADHVLVITLDDELVKRVQADGEVADPMDREFWNIDVRCEANPQDFTRTCVTWWECDCKLTDEQRDAVHADDDGPCPQSPTGRHSFGSSGLGLAHPSRDCWARVCDGMPDAVDALVDRHSLGPGEYPIHVIAGCEFVEFELELTNVVAS